MSTPVAEEWSAISGYLDEVLALEPGERERWLVDLQTRDPKIAARVSEFLGEHERLQTDGFLESGSEAWLEQGASLAGETIGAYTLDRKIGFGGTGTVWLAHRSDGRFEGSVAVKLLNIALVGHPAAQRFVREGSVLAQLDQPNIARLLDAGVAGGKQPYLVLEYVRGERIDEWCERKALGLRARVRLFLSVLDAVAHAHARLIVHRDLKPTNILVTDAGAVKLLDFGVAALLSPEGEADSQLTRQLPPGLTPGFAAPEQLRGEAISTATDVYALGVILFVLLTGRHPFEEGAANSAMLAQRAIAEDAPRASLAAADAARARELRGDLDNIIAVALRRNAKERYASVEQLALDLRRYLAYEPVSARPRSMGYVFGRFVRRNRFALGAAAAVGVVLVAATLVTTQQMLVAREERDRTRFESRRAEASKDFFEIVTMSDLNSDRPARTFDERLELGVKMLEDQYGHDPAFQGRMFVELGAGFRDSAQTRRAGELFERAYAIGKASGDTELMIEAQCNRAYSDASAGIDTGVTERLEEVRQLGTRASRRFGVEVSAVCLMARAYAEQGPDHFERAQAHLLEARRLIEADGSVHRQIYPKVLSELGILYLERNQPLQLLEISRLIGEIHDRYGRGGLPDRLIAYQNAASALSNLGELREALSEREALNRRLREISSIDQEPPMIWINYATVLWRMGRPADSLRELQQVMTRVRESGNSANLGSALSTQGAALLALGRLDEAEQVLDDSFARLSKIGGQRSSAALVKVIQARLQLARGNLDAASASADEALTLAGYKTEHTTRSLARVLLAASEIAVARHDAPRAEALARDSLAIAEGVARGPETSADVGEGLLRLVQARLAGGANGGTRPLLERAIRCLTNGFGADHPLTREARALSDKVAA